MAEAGYLSGPEYRTQGDSKIALFTVTQPHRGTVGALVDAIESMRDASAIVVDATVSATFENAFDRINFPRAMGRVAKYMLDNDIQYAFAFGARPFMVGETEAVLRDRQYDTIDQAVGSFQPN